MELLRNYGILFLLLQFLLFGKSQGQQAAAGRIPGPTQFRCPSRCVCSGTPDKETPIPMPIVTCSDANLTVIPSGIPVSAKKLDLTGNNITRVGATLLEDLKSLQELNLRSNHIREVDSNAFVSLTALKELTLARNLLKRFPTEVIQPQIELLNLAYNRIGSLDKSILKNNSRMRWLVLGNNAIDKIDEEAFEGLAHLRVLELNDNRLTEVPTALTRLANLQELNLANNRISRIDVPFHEIIPRVVYLQLRGNPILSIHLEGFSHLERLKKLILSDVKNLTEFPHLNGTSSLEILRIDRCALRYVPKDLCYITPKLKSLDLKSNELHDLPVFEGCSELKILDLSMNEIEELGEAAFQNSPDLHDIHLSHNRVNRIPADAFQGLSHLRNLDLSYNNIEDIHPQAFVPTLELEDLNLGNNLFPVLPTEGLGRVFELKTFNNPNLKEFPDPQQFPRVRRLVLSYAYHCCQFMSPDGGNSPPESSLQETVWYPTDNGFGSALSSLNLTELWPVVVNMSNKNELSNDFWKSFGPSLTTGASNVDVVGGDEIFSERGRLSPFSQQIECIPLPGPFLPCNDLFDWWTLRCGVWVVFLLALMGNGTVVFVLIFARTKMDVPRFLVCNLAIADFFMGAYLGFLAVVDAATLGEFRKFAIPWQLSTGCQMAGFLGVLSSELSVFTLAIITLERHYAITHAMHLNKRLSLRHATYIMILGWIFALLMAVLPLFGVSDYRKFAVCLPFETGDPVSKGYVVFLMFANGVAFMILMGCYLKMYCSIRGSQAWNSNDTRIAKRMALLVFTDLLCWFPIAFFSLTAVFGLHLVSLEEAKVFTVFVLPLNSCCNPFLYAILTKQFKKDCVLICKAIEESRVTRGIGRCRHSSNFSNRQTAANTGSLVEKSSKDGQPCICHSGLHPAGGDVNGNAKYRFIPAPERWSRYGPLGRFFSRYILCQNNSKEANRQARDDYRMRNVRRYLYNSAAANYPADAQKHQRHPSVSSDNFSSSRSDSWRVQGRCGIPLRLLEPRRRNSWAVTRKPSQDSNLSSSRNDSSATSNSTATWRLSRSSVSSDAASHSGGGRSSFKKISTANNAPPSTAVNVNVLNRPKGVPTTTNQVASNVPGTSQGNTTINPAVITEEEVISISPTAGQVSQVLLAQALPQRKGSGSKAEALKQKSGKKKKAKGKKRRKHNVDIMTIIDDEEASAKIATNRPRLVRQSAFFSEEVVIEPEVCPVHGPLIPGTYDDENDEQDACSDIDSTDSEDEDEDDDEDEEADQLGNDPTSPILRKPSNQIGIALVIVPRRLSTISSRDTISIRSREDAAEAYNPSTSNNIPIPGSSSASSSPTALLLPGGSAAAAFGRRKMSEQPVKFYVVPATPGLINSAKWHSMSSVEIINSPQTQPQVHHTVAQPQSRSQSPREAQQLEMRNLDEMMSSMIEVEVDEDSISEQMDSVGRFGGPSSSSSSRDPNERRVSFQLPTKNSPETRPDTS